MTELASDALAKWAFAGGGFGMAGYLLVMFARVQRDFTNRYAHELEATRAERDQARTERDQARYDAARYRYLLIQVGVDPDAPKLGFPNQG